jgi:hypothetical protein
MFIRSEIWISKIGSLSSQRIIFMQGRNEGVTLDMDFLKKKLTDRLLSGLFLPVPDKPKPAKKR